MKEIYDYLDAAGIEYTSYEHPPVFTVEAANEHCSHIPGMHCKNLFMRDHKGRRHFLLVLPNSKPVDLKSFSKKLEDRLSFASDKRLKKYLNVAAGSVSPLGLIFDQGLDVVLYLDKEVAEAEQLTFHPNDNRATLVFSKDMFKKYLDTLENKIIVSEF